MHGRKYIASRGVHSPPWYDEGGHEVLVAVTGAGRLLLAARVFSRENRDEVAIMLQRILDATDPESVPDAA
jgi:hypothetical protein